MKNVTRVDAETFDPKDTRALTELADKIVLRMSKAKDLVLDSTKKLALIKREIGEDIIRYTNPDKTMKPMNKMTFAERREVAATAGILPQASREELSVILSHHSATQGMTTAKYLRESITMAETYSATDITRAVDNYGANFTILNMLGSARKEEDIWGTLEKAKKEDKMTVQSFAALMQELSPEEFERKPRSAAAVEGHKNLKESQGEEDQEPKQKAKSKPKGPEAPASPDSPYKKFDRMLHHLTDRLQDQMSDVWTAVEDEMGELDPVDLKKAEQKFNELRKPLKDLRETIDRIFNADDERKKKANDNAVRTGKRKG